MKRQADQCLVLDTPLEVIHIKTHFPLFEKNVLAESLEKEFEFVYTVEHNHILMIVISDFRYVRHTVTEAAKEYCAETDVYVLGADFAGFEDFTRNFRG